MEERILLKLSFFGTLIFLFLSVIYFNYFLVSPISEISPGKFYCVKGNFVLKKSGKTYLIGKITDKTGELNVFVPDFVENFEVLKNNKEVKNVKLCGKIRTYKGKPEIIPSKIYVS